MGIVYLVALIVGGGALLVQFGFGLADAHIGGHDLDGHHPGGPGAAMLLSVRFWIHALLAFGMVGSTLHYFRLANPTLTGIVSFGAGVASGAFARFAFRAASGVGATSSVALEEARGQTARVLLPCAKGRAGKVRLELKGQAVDVLATTDEERIAAGARVLVHEVRGATVHVGTAPPELDA